MNLTHEVTQGEYWEQRLFTLKGPLVYEDFQKKKKNIPRDTIRSRGMFKSYVDKMPGHGRKNKHCFKACSSLVRTTKKKPHVTARHLLDDLKKGGTSASVATLRYALKKMDFMATPTRTPLDHKKHKI